MFIIKILSIIANSLWKMYIRPTKLETS